MSRPTRIATVFGVEFSNVRYRPEAADLIEARISECEAKSKELASVSNLIRCFERLNELMQREPGEVHCEIGVDFAPHSFCWALFRTQSGECFYNGGLNFHENFEHPWSLNS